jgi:hypothetical protein
VITVVIGWRFLFDFIGRRLKPRERPLLVGTSKCCDRARARDVRSPSQLGVEICRFVDSTRPASANRSSIRG